MSGRVGRAELAELAGALGRFQRLASNRRTFALAADAAGVTLTQQEMEVLRVLVHQGPSTLGELARRARMDAGAVSRQIRTLEAAGLVSRRAGGANSVVVGATTEGASVCADFEAVRAEHLGRALRAWTPAERAAFAELLGRFVDDTSRTPYEVSDRAVSAPALR